jgi:eukaryotic-like serine/threonine-protein kinase
MVAISASALAEALADERMLEPEQFDLFCRTMLSVCQDVPILAQELAYRGWLTPFQIEQILAGRAHTLILGSYVLLEPLGEGGMGRVFRARNWKLNRQVAVKVIREEQAQRPAVMARFRREIRALSHIHHPNIVMAIDADLAPGSIWYAMEYVSGVDLGRYVKNGGPAPIQEACDVVVQVADALQHAHDRGFVHRDIKPSNLLRCEVDHSIKLLDLGLTRCALSVDDAAFAQLTRVGALIGTPDYMSPEQIEDSRCADIRSDLYSLGCTFYFLLTGQAPFEDTVAPVDKLRMHCESVAAPVEKFRPDVPPGVAHIVRKLMAKRRRDRFQSSAELIPALLKQQGQAAISSETVVDTRQTIACVDWQSSPRTQPTEVISHFDVENVSDTQEIEIESTAATSPSSGRLSLVRNLIAIALATLALICLWQMGMGPGALRDLPAQSKPGSTLPQIQEPTAPNQTEVFGKDRS